MRKTILILLILVLLVGCKEKELSSGPSEYERYMGFIQLTDREQRLANTVTNSDSLIMEYNVEKREKIYLVVDWYKDGKVIETQEYINETNKKEGFIVINSNDENSINPEIYINDNTMNCKMLDVSDVERFVNMRRGFSGNVEINNGEFTCIYYKGYKDDGNIRSNSAIDFTPSLMKQFTYGFSIKVKFE